MGADFGWSRRIAPISEDISSDFQNYVNELKTGYHLGVDFEYFITENMSLGGKYSYFHAVNQLDNIYAILDDGSVVYGMMKDDINIQFWGPDFTAYLDVGGKHNALFGRIALGYLKYQDSATLFEDYKITAGTFGSVMDLGLDIPISKNLALRFGFSVTQGVLTKIKLEQGGESLDINLEKEEYENISRFDISLGLRFRK